MKDIIEEANKKRFKLADDDQGKRGIAAISEAWMKELTKHPYYSSKVIILIDIGKPGTGIFLMKEKAKLYKAHRQRSGFSLSKRLADDDDPMRPEEEKTGSSNKRIKANDGSMQPVPASKNQSQTGPGQ
jgi:hypothetical protein